MKYQTQSVRRVDGKYLEAPLVGEPRDAGCVPARIQLGSKVYQLEFDGKVFRLTHGGGRVVREGGEPLQTDLTYKISDKPYRWKTDERFYWKG